MLIHYAKRTALQIFLTLAVTLSFGGELSAQNQSAEDANRALAAAFESAWNTHDMQKLDSLVTEDVDWINVDGGHGRGRKDIVQGHVKVHAGPKFKDSVFTVKRTDVSLLKPDVAIMHVQWALRGDRDNDGTERQPREGVFTWVTVHDGTSWRIRASHNSNKTTVR